MRPVRGLSPSGLRTASAVIVAASLTCGGSQRSSRTPAATAAPSLAAHIEAGRWHLEVSTPERTATLAFECPAGFVPEPSESAGGPGHIPWFGDVDDCAGRVFLAKFPCRLPEDEAQPAEEWAYRLAYLYAHDQDIQVLWSGKAIVETDDICGEQRYGFVHGGSCGTSLLHFSLWHGVLRNPVDDGECVRVVETLVSPEAADLPGS